MCYWTTLHTSNGTVFWQNNVASVKTSFSATGVVNWVNSNPPSGGGNSVNGTAHAKTSCLKTLRNGQMN